MSQYHNEGIVRGQINMAIEHQMNFIVREIGHSVELDFITNKIKGKDNYIFKEGFFLSKLVMDDVAHRLKDGLYVPRNKDNEREKVNTIMFNPTNIIKYLNKPMVSVDINSCYFNTAWLIGAISDKTYEKGFKKDREYKNARNTSIGSLGARIVEKKYINGKLIGYKCFHRPFNIVRLDVIDHVWKIANTIARKIKKDFCMFLTDAFFINKSAESKIYDLLAEYGYKAKTEDILITKILFDKKNTHTYQVFWDKKNDLGKYHYFNPHHIL